MDKNELIQTAIRCYRDENLPQSEAYCRYLLSSGYREPVIYVLLGTIARRLELNTFAVDYYREALSLDPANSDALQGLEAAQQVLNDNGENPVEADSGSHRFLLIKAWGHGFWAEVDHVLGQLLLAEITHRTPVVHWGKNCLFGDRAEANAFNLYFEPVSDSSIKDLAGLPDPFFPPKWNAGNLEEDVNKWEGDYSRMAGSYFLARPEKVAVSDFHTYVKDLAPWIPQDNSLHGKDPQAIYHYLFRKYIRLLPELQGEVDRIRDQKLAGKTLLAVHVRGSDKIIEAPDLVSTYQDYHKSIERLMKEVPGIFIYLLTDSKAVLDEYRQLYGDRIVFNDCARSDDEIGTHHKEHDSKFVIGKEVLLDAYLAARCDFFLGTGSSNVSTAILHMKEWAEGRYILQGHNYLFGSHLGLHKREQVPRKPGVEIHEK